MLWHKFLVFGARPNRFTTQQNSVLHTPEGLTNLNG